MMIVSYYSTFFFFAERCLSAEQEVWPPGADTGMLPPTSAPLAALAALLAYPHGGPFLGSRSWAERYKLLSQILASSTGLLCALPFVLAFALPVASTTRVV